MAFIRSDLFDRPEETYRGRGETGNPRSPVEPAADRLDTLLELLDLARGPAWHADAACRRYAGITWFPARGEDASTARLVCEDCPVRDECAAAGARERFGVWGGKSEYDRRKGRRAA